jgi:hypothetical protein
MSKRNFAGRKENMIFFPHGSSNYHKNKSTKKEPAQKEVIGGIEVIGSIDQHEMQ